MIDSIPIVGTWWMWSGFIGFVLAMLAVDLYVFGEHKAHRVSAGQALRWVFLWISLSLIFNALLWYYLYHETQNILLANQKALEFLSGYILELSLSTDNLFVFLMIFEYFKVPLVYQRRVLLYGILGAIIMRLVMILLGIWFVMKFHWILYVFGAFLIFTGIKMLTLDNDKDSFEHNPIINWLKKHLRLTKDFHEEKFFVKHNGFWHATPLFLVIVFIELSDVIFAVDSIPAIFGITQDPFIIFTSNIFAILGLRALYFLLADLSDKFQYIKYGVSLILMFIGVKMLIVDWYKIPVVYALLAIISTLFISVLFSIYKTRKPIR